MTKKIILNFFLMIILGHTPQDAFSLTTAESKIEKFELKNCVGKSIEKKCLKLTADKAQSSQFLPLYVLTNIKIEITTNQKINVIEASSGYVDFTQDMVQIDLKNGAELTLNLKNLEEKNY